MGRTERVAVAAVSLSELFSVDGTLMLVANRSMSLLVVHSSVQGETCIFVLGVIR